MDLEDCKPKESPGTPMSVQSGASTPTLTATPVDQKPDDNKENVVEDSKISVKERMQKFDRMASESALLSKNTSSLNTNLYKKRQEKLDRDEEDTGSVTLIDAKTREWLVKCAQGDYQGIVKMAAENPKLVKFKDPNGYTALHWAAKHGNEDLIKLIAGTHAANVNAKTNGGYTPLHIAMQYGHDECYNLLVEVYGADHNIRDYSGKKPRQYLTNKGTSVSVDTFRKIKAMKKHAAEKDLGFLRIGSLNVRVKRTTEAFSNFLGVGNPDKLHKHWGSADNLHQGDNKRMPPPKFAPIKKRKSKRGQQDFGTPIRAQSLIEKRPEPSNQDSDSDTAAGFGSSWQSTV
uniref:Ankyrin repeat domain-containing protein SOWAHB n=2 Tax=Lygus hesperus TaxID=30085 RepID=A0A0A9X106_LYGHE